VREAESNSHDLPTTKRYPVMEKRVILRGNQWHPLRSVRGEMTERNTQDDASEQAIPYHQVAWLIVLWVFIFAWISPLASVG
jgi:hypothetical protein